jgi:hypothetical protein
MCLPIHKRGGDILGSGVFLYFGYELVVGGGGLERGRGQAPDSCCLELCLEQGGGWAGEG